MVCFNKKYVQIWKEERVILLINHYWKGVDFFRKNGFKCLYQKVTEKELKEIMKLSNDITEEEYNQIVCNIGNRLFNRLVKYNFLIERENVDDSIPCDYSIAGDNLAPYMKNIYGIEHINSPTKVQFLLTYRCFGNCSFCLTNSKYCTEVDEITDCDWELITKRICDELNPCQIDLIGGEPLIRFEAVKRICKIAVQKNVMVRIITNGVILEDEKRCKELVEILRGYRHYIQISIDGDEKIHNMIRPGAQYERMMKAIENISREDLYWGANITITKLNINTVSAVLKNIAVFNPVHFELGPIQTSVKDIEMCKKLVINKEEEGKLRKQLKELKELYPDIDIAYNKREKIFETQELPLGSDRIYQMCSAFDKLLAVGADARLIPCLRGCVHPEFYAENVLEWKDNLKSLWKFSKLRNVFQKITLKHKCKNCNYNQQCNQGCPLETYVLTGDLGGYDPNCAYVPQKGKE